MQNVHFTPPQLAPLFGVNVSTIKRWVDRGFLRSDITSGKHRRISQQQLTEFIKNNPRHAKNSYVLRKLLNRADHISSEIWHTYYEKLLTNNSLAAEKIFDHLFLKGYAVIKIIEEVITPTLRHIGNEWEKGTISVYEEHRMSFMIRMHLMKLDQFIPAVTKKTAPKAVLACAPGEHHELPLQLAGLVLKQKNWKTDILGIDINVTELIKAADEVKPKIIVISKTYSSNIDTFINQIVKYAKQKNIYLVLGGIAWPKIVKKNKSLQQNCVRYFSSMSDFCKYLS